ncbi:MAG: glycoside hydrolase family 3 C-terminal domain-containing protein [Bifidobacteriaceae bacterium]|nr:glycoside hydrolase family 3 C-terminal domain-containing protein [Bifidobacteriaceae bacterium]
MVSAAALGAGGLLATGLLPAVAAPVASPTASSPAVAADAPYTPTVNWLLSQLTTAEKVLIIEHSNDSVPHGEAGFLASVPRLGIPAIRHADAMGINTTNETTAFQTRLGMAASFDRSLVSDIGQEIGIEGVGSDIDLLYGPQVDVDRYPSWGRNLTTNGEDAFLSGELAQTEINGTQSEGLMSQIKHAAFYNGQNQSTPSWVSSQAAHEVYLEPYQMGIEQGGVSSIMCSYATFRIVGEQDSSQYACSNQTLETKILKDEFGLSGFITTDYGGGKATSDLIAGTDNEFASSNFSATKITAALQNGLTYDGQSYTGAQVATQLNDAVARMLYQYERFGLLDLSQMETAGLPAADVPSEPQHGDVQSIGADNSTQITFHKTAETEALAQKSAEESITLLKNTGSVLPLATTSKLNVVGPTSQALPSSPGGERSRGLMDTVTENPVTALRDTFGTANVSLNPGVGLIGTAIPTANLNTKEDGTGTTGLTVTGTDGSQNTVARTVQRVNNQSWAWMTKGGKYTFSGSIKAATAGTYRVYLQYPYGCNTGNTSDFNGGNTDSGRGCNAASASVTINGASVRMSNPDSLLQPNDIAGGQTNSVGEYTGQTNVAADLTLNAGFNPISITYSPATTMSVAPTLKLSWANTTTELNNAVTAAAVPGTTSVVFMDDSGGQTYTDGQTAVNGSAQMEYMPDDQVNLLEQVAASAHAAGNKVVVVTFSGGAFGMPWASDADAIVQTWYPGEMGSPAIANVLSGAVDPSGRLSITFPVDNNHSAFTDSPKETNSTATSDGTNAIVWSDGVDVGYRWYSDPSVNVNGYEPAYWFGYGESYTSFAYSDLAATESSDGGLDVTFTVKNTGDVAGAAVPQIYLGPSPDLQAPVDDADGLVAAGYQQSKEKLVQFDRVELAAGASKTETLHVDAQQVSAWDTASQSWVLGTGVRSLWLGTSSNPADVAQSVAVKVSPLDRSIKDVLQAVVAADSVYQANQSLYEATSYATFESALTAAQALLNNPSTITTANAQAAMDALQSAVAALQAKSDLTPLQSLITAATTAVSDTTGYYQQANVPALQTALTAAQAVAADPSSTQDEITAQVIALSGALQKVLPIGSTLALQDLVTQVGALDQARYSATSWSALQTALAAANAVIAATEPDQYQVDEAYDNLAQACNALVFVSNKQALATDMAVAANILANADAYYAESISGLQAAYDAAEVVYNEQDATDTQVSVADSNLMAWVLKAKLMPTAQTAAVSPLAQPAAASAKVVKAASTVKVAWKDRTVKAGHAATIKVKVLAAGTANPAGTVKVKANGKTKSYSTAKVAANNGKVKLPTITKKGTYTVKVYYSGSQTTAAKTLKLKAKVRVK